MKSRPRRHPVDPAFAPEGYIAVPAPRVPPFQSPCLGCAFGTESQCGSDRPCTPNDRPDRQQVIFTSNPECMRYHILYKATDVGNAYVVTADPERAARCGWLPTKFSDTGYKRVGDAWAAVANLWK